MFGDQWSLHILTAGVLQGEGVMTKHGLQPSLASIIISQLVAACEAADKEDVSVRPPLTRAGESRGEVY